MTISMIVAMAENRAIGKDNQLLWKLSGDMKHFRAITTGHTVVMGRNTYLSIGRPLPNRRNIILSRTLKAEDVPGCEVFSTIEALLNDESLQREEVIIMGGGEIYRQFMEKADKLYVTHVHTAPQADTYFPEIDEQTWLPYSSEKFAADEKNEFDYEFVNYIRRKK